MMLPITIKTQPNDVSCGPTSLQAVYHYYQDDISLNQVMREVPALEDGGTLAVYLANHAIMRGYRAKIYVYNLNLFDMTWEHLPPLELIAKLRAELPHKHNRKAQHAIKAYIRFVELGGEVLFYDLTPALLKKYFNSNIPVLAGLNSTYLYQCAREFFTDKKSVYDDVKGTPTGHFVVLYGWDENKKQIIVADPYRGNPLANDNYYKVDMYRLINAIMLGVITYEGNLLIIEKI